MKISALESLLEKSLPHKRRLLVVGPPGVGKSFAKRAVCRRIGWDYIPLSAPLQSPVKVGGYPKASADPAGDATHQLFNGIARAFRATRPTLLDWDDLGMGGGETLKSILDLVQFGTIDDKTLPDCVTIGASSNDVGHGADVQGMIEPLKNRWHSIIHVELDIDDVVLYGLTHGWPGWLLGWAKNDVSWATSWKPTKSLKVDGCTPRGIEYVAEWDAIGIDDVEVWAGAVGSGSAASMLAFKGLQAELPDIDQVLLDPTGAPVPENPSAKWLISMALATRLDGNTFGPALVYLQRLTQPLRFFSIKSAFHAESARRADGTLPAGYKPIHAARDFVAWTSTEDGKDLLSAHAASRG